MEVKPAEIETIGALIVGAITFLLAQFREPIFAWARRIVEKFTGKKEKPEEPFGAIQAERERRINDICVELRYKTDSDRCYIFKFHNGEYFSPRDPLWKLTCTNEAVRTGYAYSYQACRAILVSYVIEWLLPIFGATDITGTGRIDKARCTCENKCSVARHICYYDVRSMDECSAKAFLIERGAHFIIVAPLMRDDHAIGFVGIDYCTEVEQGAMLLNAQEVCRSANLVAYLMDMGEVDEGN